MFRKGLYLGTDFSQVFAYVFFTIPVPDVLASIDKGSIYLSLMVKYSAVFARSKSGILGSNPTRGMDVCVRLFHVCIVLCVCSGLATG
jgi:hypothetical protein